MKNEHILDILDEKAFSELSESEKYSIKAHAAHCPGCLRAYKAARIGSLLLREKVGETIAPSPFFQTRVLANLREKQVSMNPFPAFGKMWKASRNLVAMMTTIVAVLVVLTIYAPKFNTVSSAGFEGDSTEMVILNERVSTKEPTNEQVFQIIYGASDADR